MPIMSGIEFAGRVRAELDVADTPIIFCTATLRVSEANSAAEQCGVAAVLIKPVEPQAVLDAVAAALDAGSSAPLPADVAERTFEFMDVAQPDYLQSLTALQSSLRETLDDAIGKADLQEHAHGAVARAGINALYPFSLRLEALLQLNVALTSERNPQAMLTLFCRSAQKIINCKYLALAILDRDRKHLRSITTRGLSNEVRNRFESIDGPACSARLSRRRRRFASRVTAQPTTADCRTFIRSCAAFLCCRSRLTPRCMRQAGFISPTN
jgi:DNA-binding response OmpR family regulator